MDILKKFEMPDDKELVIYAVTLISLCALFLLKGDAISIIENVIVGMFGIAVGRTTK